MEPKLLLNLFILLVVSNSVSSSFYNCSPCYCNENRLTCPRIGLTEFNITDKQLPIYRVSLRGNLIKRIDAHTFQNFPNVSYLDLSLNRIQEIDPLAFRSLTSLHRLDLSSNKMENTVWNTFNYYSKHEELETHFRRLYTILQNCSVTELLMSYNYLTEIQADEFIVCPSLENLQLNDNFIRKLDPNAFNGLKYLRVLNLSRNKLTTLTPDICITDYPPPLEMLDISKNSLDVFDTDIILKCSYLRILFLDHNNINIISEFKLLQFLFAREDEAFENYKIDSLECKSEPQLRFLDSYLTHLDLSHNNIKTATNIFQYFQHLVYLDLSKNDFENFPPYLICLMNKSDVDIKLEGPRFMCECDNFYDVYLMAKKYQLGLNLSCLYMASHGSWYIRDDWAVMENALLCDSREIPVKYPVTLTLTIVASLIVIIGIVGGITYYLRKRTTRDINPDTE